MSKAWKVEGSFIPRRLDMLQSVAWKCAPRALKALLEELEIEHMRHKGSANGQLFRSYSQFIDAGLNRTTVATMTRTGEALGLLRINRETGVRNSQLRDACSYELTYLPTGIGQDKAPSDDWRRIKTAEQAAAAIARARKPIRKPIREKIREAA